jgi:hypothetical protein
MQLPVMAVEKIYLNSLMSDRHISLSGGIVVTKRGKICYQAWEDMLPTEKENFVKRSCNSKP